MINPYPVYLDGEHVRIDMRPTSVIRRELALRIRQAGYKLADRQTLIDLHAGL